MATKVLTLTKPQQLFHKKKNRVVVVDLRANRIIFDFINTGPERVGGLSSIAGICIAVGINPDELVFLSDLDETKAEDIRALVKNTIRVVRERTPECLTRREAEILPLVMKGLANKEIAPLVGLSVRTIKFHVSNLLLKYNVKSRWALSRAANGLQAVG